MSQNIIFYEIKKINKICIFKYACFKLKNIYKKEFNFFLLKSLDHII